MKEFSLSFTASITAGTLSNPVIIPIGLISLITVANSVILVRSTACRSVLICLKNWLIFCCMLSKLMLSIVSCIDFFASNTLSGRE